MKCQYVERLSDVNKILLSPEIIEKRGVTDIPVMGAVYIGCYEEDIVSLLVWNKGLFHFYVLKPYRKKAREYFKESEKLIPSELIYCAPPVEDQKLINFLLKVGLQKIKEANGKLLMGKVNEQFI